MTIDINIMIKITENILNNLKNNSKEIIYLKKDFYWDIEKNEVYDPYKTPNSFTLGQLSDDLNELYRLLDVKNDPIPYDLKRLSEVLKAISIDENISDY